MLKISWFFLTNYIGPLLMHISNYVDSNQIQIINMETTSSWFEFIARAEKKNVGP